MQCLFSQSRMSKKKGAPRSLSHNSVAKRTHRVFELLADRADDRQRLLELGGQLVCIHVSQAEHVAHLQPETGPDRVS